MSEPLERLEARLKLAGWVVRERERVEPDVPLGRDYRWLVESTRHPLHAQAELRLRVQTAHRYGAYGRPYEVNDYLASVLIRSPLSGGATSDAEANLVGGIDRDNYRRLVLILGWFRDPLSGDFWEDPPLEGEWQPPGGHTTRAGQQAALGDRWDTHGDAQEMLRLLPHKASDRKLRLIACACARLLNVAQSCEHNRAAIGAAERYADGLCPRKEMKKLCKHSEVAWLADRKAQEAARQAIYLLNGQGAAARAADVVREIFGDPFRPVTLRHEWLRNAGGAVAHLAAAIRDESRYEDMPILADALEDASCTVAAVLDHCRAPVRHARGCWVLDLLLGKG
jgi:hypothetical protein